MHTVAVTHAKHCQNRTIFCTKVRDAIEIAVSWEREFTGLLENGTVIRVHKDLIPADTRIYSSRFIDKLKGWEKGTQRQSLLVAQTGADDGACKPATK